MATIQMNSGHQVLYKSPYFVSTYDRQGNKDKRSGDHLAYNPSSNYLVGEERNIINLDSDANDGFVDIDELLSDMQQKNITASGTIKRMDVESASGSSVAFSQPTQRSTQDLVTASTESETDYRNPPVDPTTISDSDPLHNAASDIADGDNFGSGITLIDDARLLVNVGKEAEDGIVADDEDDDDTCSTKRLDSPIDFGDELGSCCDESISELLDDQYGIPEDGGSDDSDDEDYDDMKNAAASDVRHQPRSRKRVKRAKDTEPSDMETAFTQSLDALYQASAATSSISMQESEEIPIRGYLRLKTIESKVVYCVTFSQEVFRESGGTSQRQPRSVSSSSNKRNSDQLSVSRSAVKKSQFSTEEDNFLRQLKEEGFSWDEIKDRFSDRFHEGIKGFHDRSKGTLQVHYSKKLKPRSQMQGGKKRRRSDD